tara:strand:+ start:1549 stop:1686 length:138 start_codon:yes stop_codon:yes gene_type:complete
MRDRKENTRDQFIRIAMARIKPLYPFYPQRIAIAARMYRNWIDKK